MFAPIGKKKILLKIMRAKELGVKKPHEVILRQEAELNKSKQRTSSPSRTATGKHGDDTSVGSFSPSHSVAEATGINQSPEKQVTASTNNLFRLLKSKTLIGKLMRQLLECTVNYKPETDTVVQKAFETSEMPYAKFKELLHVHLKFAISEADFREFITVFDPNSVHYVDGYDFMKTIVKLGGIRKDRELKRRKELESKREEQQTDEQKRKEAEDLKRLLGMVSFEYSEALETHTINKITAAAKKFDQTAPGCKSLKGFEGSSMNIPTFRDMIQRTFNLHFGPTELGVLLDQFDHVKKSDGTIEIDCKVFLRFFLKLGITARDEERQEAMLAKSKLE